MNDGWTMKGQARGQVWIWIARGLALGFAGFLGIFALDVFQEGRGFLDLAVALFMHLVPTWLVLGCVWLSWRREWLGAVVFSGLALTYVVTGWGRLHWSAHAVIAGPMLVLAGAYLGAWRVRRRAGSSRSAGLAGAVGN